jgi:hypothetical protein
MDDLGKSSPLDGVERKEGDHRMMRTSRFAFLVLVVIAATSPPIAATADEKKWDQAAVSGAAQQLSQACDRWQNAILRQPAGGVGSGMAGPDDAMTRRARVLLEQSQGLAAELKKGSGPDKTKDMFLSFKEAYDDNEVSVARAGLDAPTQAAWKQVVTATEQLAPYYGVKLH